MKQQFFTAAGDFTRPYGQFSLKKALAEASAFSGTPSGIRTLDTLIKSQVL